jgi:hypothetical protein
MKAMTWFGDINYNEPIKMAAGMKLNWKVIEKRLKSMQNSPDKVFDQPI